MGDLLAGIKRVHVFETGRGVLSYTMKISLFWWESHSARIRVSCSRKSWRASLYRNLRFALPSPTDSVLYIRLLDPIDGEFRNNIAKLHLPPSTPPQVGANIGYLRLSKCLSLRRPGKKIVSGVQTRHRWWWIPEIYLSRLTEVVATCTCYVRLALFSINSTQDEGRWFET